MNNVETNFDKSISMSKRIKVLVFPSGTEIAFEIFNALKYSKYIELYGANSVNSHADYLFKNNCNDLPFIHEDGFIRSLNNVIDEKKIDYLYPAHDSALYYLTREKDKIHCKVVTSDWRTVDICRSKNRTYSFFKNEEFVPTFYKSAKDIKKFPIFAKPAVGQGSVGATIVNNQRELNNIIECDEEYALCEFLPGSEYTVDCFTDINQVLRTVHIRQRNRIKTGIAVRSTIIPLDSKVQQIAGVINERLKFNGAWFFQLKKNSNGEYKLMEIAPRIAGTMGLTRNLGINYPLLTLYNMCGQNVEILDNGNIITLDRAFISRYDNNFKYKMVYLDFDDTICIDGKINIMVIAFIYQCQNKGIPITLITKHKENLKETLAQFGISERLFSEIIQMTSEDNKADYIKKGEKAIFIDDSFSERKKVKDSIGIPVFDIDMLEALIDWRK